MLFHVISVLLLAVFVTVQGCKRPPDRAIRIVPDDQPLMSIVASQPFSLDFGRGSGRYGLMTVSVNQSGAVVVRRPRRGRSGFERVKFKFTANEVSKLLKLIQRHQILHLARQYHDDRMMDGTQWVFLLTQGKSGKAIYFNNHFPASIKSFADDLDKLLKLPSRNLNWTPDTTGDSEKKLWDAIKTTEN